MNNILFPEEILARSLITKIDDIIDGKWNIPQETAWLASYIRKHPKYGLFVTADYKNQTIGFCIKNEKEIPEIAAMAHETFAKEQYKKLDVKGKVVFDIGAAIGDSAIFFIMNGAKHVYALEPQPQMYNKALKNIKLNKLEKKITVLNEALGREPGIIKLQKVKETMGGTELEPSNWGEEIKVTTIPELVKRFKIKNNAVLKMDIEGWEQHALLRTQYTKEAQSIMAFEQIILEYHYGWKDLSRWFISMGYKTSHTLPRVVFYNKSMRLGLLYAQKVI